MGSSAEPTLNGHLKYNNNLDQSLNDAALDGNPPNRATGHPSPVPC
jgi:hypothetical protein